MIWLRRKNFTQLFVSVDKDNRSFLDKESPTWNSRNDLSPLWHGGLNKLLPCTLLLLWMDAKILIRLWLKVTRWMKKLPSIYLSDLYLLKLKLRHWRALEPTGATLWVTIIKSLAKQLRCLADPNQTHGPTLCLISKTSPLLTLLLTKSYLSWLRLDCHYAP